MQQLATYSSALTRLAALGPLSRSAMQQRGDSARKGWMGEGVGPLILGEIVACRCELGTRGSIGLGNRAR